MFHTKKNTYNWLLVDPIFLHTLNVRFPVFGAASNYVTGVGWVDHLGSLSNQRLSPISGAFSGTTAVASILIQYLSAILL